jgi:hypothetical protein
MNIKDWQHLVTFNPPDGSPELDCPWIKIIDYVVGPRILKFEATGRWQCMEPPQPGSCGPNGYLGLSWPAANLSLPTSAPGALIGKLGGSTIDLKDGTIFGIGTFALLAVPEKTIQPVFVGINGAPSKPGLALMRLNIVVSSTDPN